MTSIRSKHINQAYWSNNAKSANATRKTKLSPKRRNKNAAGILVRRIIRTIIKANKKN